MEMIGKGDEGRRVGCREETNVKRESVVMFMQHTN